MNKSIAATIFVCIVLIGCVSQPAYRCDSNIQETTPTSRFEENWAYGVAFDKKTQLTWKICSEGQSYSGGHCYGSATDFAWDKAMQAFGDQGVNWRLPHADELKSIVEERCQKPAINIAVFPNTPPSPFWSASSHDTIQSKAWYVSFIKGRSYSTDKTIRHNVRLVRGESAKVLEEQREQIIELIEQNRIEELLKQENEAAQNAYANCNNTASCNRLFSLTQTYITSESSKSIRVVTDKIIETYNPNEVGDIGMSAMIIPGTGNSAKVHLSVSCMVFGSDILIENLKSETEASESLRSKMKKSKISCLSRKISIYRGFRSFVTEE